MKDAYYFSHDSNARNDLKVMKLRRVLGMEGYGVFWAIVEMLREAEDYMLPLDSVEEIAFELRVDPAIVGQVVWDFGLFEGSETHFSSPSLCRRMEPLDDLREKRRRAGRIGGKKSGIARAKTKQNEASASAVLKQTPSKTNLSKVKESKGNKKKGNESNAPAREEITPETLINSIRSHSVFEIAKVRAEQDGLNFDDEADKWACYMIENGNEGYSPGRLAASLKKWILNAKTFERKPAPKSEPERSNAAKFILAGEKLRQDNANI